MEHLKKPLGTVAVWTGVTGLCFVLGSLGILDGGGAGLMILAAFITTICIWASRQPYLYEIDIKLFRFAR